MKPDASIRRVFLWIISIQIISYEELQTIHII